MSDQRQGADVGEPPGRLHGWDDGKVYYFGPDDEERCVSDEPELERELVELCRIYFAARPADDETGGA